MYVSMCPVSGRLYWLNSIITALCDVMQAYTMYWSDYTCTTSVISANQGQGWTLKSFIRNPVCLSLTLKFMESQWKHCLKHQMLTICTVEKRAWSNQWMITMDTVSNTLSHLHCSHIPTLPIPYPTPRLLVISAKHVWFLWPLKLCMYCNI